MAFWAGAGHLLFGTAASRACAVIGCDCRDCPHGQPQARAGLKGRVCCPEVFKKQAWELICQAGSEPRAVRASSLLRGASAPQHRDSWQLARHPTQRLTADCRIWTAAVVCGPEA